MATRYKLPKINATATLNIDAGHTLDVSGGNVSMVGAGSATVTFPSATSTLATLALAETLTNKDLTSSTNTYKTASTTVLGAVKVDGTTIVISGGVISSTGGGGGSGVSSVTSATGDATVANTTSTPVITIVSAPKLTTARTIAGVSFNGTANIAIPIDNLSDVDTTTATPTKDQVLKWNGTNWIPAAYNASFTFSISGFSSTAGGNSSVFEMGVASSTWKAIGANSFSASYNNGPATGGYVSHSGWSNLTLGGVGYVGPTTNVTAILYPTTVGSTKAFTLNATDGTTSPTSTITYYFYNNRFWGISTVSGSYTEANVEGLASQELSNSKGKTFTVTSGTNDYIIYAYPSRLGTANFNVGGFDGGFEAPQTVSITNPSGYNENYYVYRSTNKNLGVTTVTVS